MSRQTWLAKVVYFPGLLLGCFIFGWMIPTFYEWTDSNQGRPTPVLVQAAWSLVSIGILSWFLIPWLPIRATAASDSQVATAQEQSNRFQFNLRWLFVITTIVAIAIAGISNGPVAFCILLWVVAFVGASLMVSKELSWKWQLGALLACMYFPFAWVLVWKTFRNASWTLLIGVIGLPALLPGATVAGLFGKHPDQFIWLYILLTAVEIAIGFWLIRTGPRRTTAYLVLVMLLSIYGSMFLNIVARM